MTSNEFEKELQELDSRFTVIDNPTRPGLSNIFYDGKNYDLPVISTNDIKDEIDTAYQYEFPNGMRARHWSKPEIMGRIELFLKDMKAGKFNDYHEEA